ncbi:uncharacterized protein CIMG_07741 [Coccidioides immitis RS]|uniref:Uncharacterized protein n=1 Tax=Coccidioides immitis (strain RS) TaxID=246410 RepID=A0A0E1RV29_COCIM|nr:uncharacterized protein CIMG_07741 [Coccidioides immitis RS]EAS28995.2 hypothetical protein CIMG_07741 [Coccidioides immitis RS]
MLPKLGTENFKRLATKLVFLRQGQDSRKKSSSVEPIARTLPSGMASSSQDDKIDELCAKQRNTVDWSFEEALAVEDSAGPSHPKAAQKLRVKKMAKCPSEFPAIEKQLFLQPNETVTDHGEKFPYSCSTKDGGKTNIYVVEFDE